MALSHDFSLKGFNGLKKVVKRYPYHINTTGSVPELVNAAGETFRANERENLTRDAPA